jgi:hypothetical protein
MVGDGEKMGTGKKLEIGKILLELRSVRESEH